MQKNYTKSELIVEIRAQGYLRERKCNQYSTEYDHAVLSDQLYWWSTNAVLVALYAAEDYQENIESDLGDTRLFMCHTRSIRWRLYNAINRMRRRQKKMEAKITNSSQQQPHQKAFSTIITILIRHKTILYCLNYKAWFLMINQQRYEYIPQELHTKPFNVTLCNKFVPLSTSHALNLSSLESQSFIRC